MKKYIFLLFFATLQLHLFAQHSNAVFLKEAKFITGNDTAYSSEQFNDTQWKTIKTGEVWQQQGYPNYHGYAWYRIHVVIPSSLKNVSRWKDSLRIFLAHVNDVDETYFNGEKIGKTGAYPYEPGGYVSRWPAERAYCVAMNSSLIKWDAENIIAIKVYDGGGTGGIFMGNPYIDAVEKIDGIAVEATTDKMELAAGKENTVPITVKYSFQAPSSISVKCKVYDAVEKKTIQEINKRLNVSSAENSIIQVTIPGRQGIQLQYAITEENSGKELEKKGVLSFPYILTPPAPPTPLINNAKVVGIRPGSPFLFKIAATGKKPLKYSVSNLPKGLAIDEKTGVITGVLVNKGTHVLNVTVSNRIGQATQKLTIYVGEKLTLTPPMGWNSWNCWGLSVSDEKVKSSAQALIDKGLIDYGWTYMNIDDGWEEPKRANDSSVIANSKFPDMKGLGNWLHERGLKFGIYSSPGPLTCGRYLGSYLNEEKDAEIYASWGVDYLKYDWCSYGDIAKGDTTLEAYIKPYRVMQQALRKQNRDIIYSLCQYGMKDVWKWGNQVDAQLWRTTGDIEDTWESLYDIGFGQAPLHGYAEPGRWNDPDMMIVGQVGWGPSLHPTRLTPDEQYTHVSLWAMLSAPLLIGCDLSSLDDFTLGLLTNREVIAIDQDVLGKQAKGVLKTSTAEVWLKELEDGSKAMAVFNMSNEYKKIDIRFNEIDLPETVMARDVWRQKDMGKLSKGIAKVIAPHGVVLYKVK